MNGKRHPFWDYSLGNLDWRFLLELVSMFIAVDNWVILGANSSFLATLHFKVLFAQCLFTSFFIFYRLLSMVFITVYSPLTPPPFLDSVTVINLGLHSLIHCDLHYIVQFTYQILNSKTHYHPYRFNISRIIEIVNIPYSF